MSKKRKYDEIKDPEPPSTEPMPVYSTDQQNTNNDYEDTEINPEINKMLDEAPEVELLDESSLKRLVLKLEKAINRNIEQRTKFSEEPEKFMDSEVELDEQIKQLQLLAASPELYSSFVKLNAVPSMVSLLSHENTDIVNDVIEAISELMDPETVAEAEDSLVLIDAMVENQLMEHLIGTLKRLDEKQEDEAQAVYNALSIFENISELKPELCAKDVISSQLVPWLIQRVQTPSFSQVKLYASEIIAVYLQTGGDPLLKTIGEHKERMDGLLQAVAVYIRHEPETIEETEVVENLFDAICCTMTMQDNQTVFRRLEGIELIMKMVKEKKYIRHAGIKTLDYCLMRSPRNCQRFVQLKGLKLFFGLFMKLTGKNEPSSEDIEDEEHLISMLMSLTTLLGSDSVEMKRMVSKFKENEYEKLQRLIHLVAKYSRRVRDFEKRVESGEISAMLGLDAEDPDAAETIYLEKLDSGKLFTAQQLGIALAEISRRSQSIRGATGKLLETAGVNADAVRGMLEEYAAHLGDERDDEGDKRKEQNEDEPMMNTDDNNNNNNNNIDDSHKDAIGQQRRHILDLAAVYSSL